MNHNMAFHGKHESALGEQALVTLSDPSDASTSVTVRLVRGDAGWLGMIDDRAAILERARMGATSRLVVERDGGSLVGDVDLTILGPVGSARSSSALVRLVAGQAFGFARALLVQIVPRALSRAPTEDDAFVGAVPRT